MASCLCTAYTITYKDQLETISQRLSTKAFEIINGVQGKLAQMVDIMPVEDAVVLVHHKHQYYQAGTEAKLADCI